MPATHALKIAHWYHAYAFGNWQKIVTSHLEALESSGLAAEVGTLHLGIIGPQAERLALAALCAKHLPVEIEAQADTGWEQVTLEALRKKAGTFDVVLYAHTKGVSNPEGSDEHYENIWRWSMTAELITGWQKCVALLDEHEAVGCHWVCHSEVNRYCNDPGTYFYGGNFWWAQSSLLKRLKPPRADTRYDAELWFSLNGPVDAFDLTPGWPEPKNFTAPPPMVNVDTSGRYRGKT